MTGTSGLPSWPRPADDGCPSTSGQDTLRSSNTTGGPDRCWPRGYHGMLLLVKWVSVSMSSAL